MRLRLFGLLIIASWLTTWLGTGAALAEKRVALVIGNSAYKNVGRLANPRTMRRWSAACSGRLGSIRSTSSST